MIDMAKYKLTDKIIIFFVAILAIYGIRIVYSQNEGFYITAIPSSPRLPRTTPLPSTSDPPTWAIIFMGVVAGIAVIMVIGAIIYFSRMV